MAQRNQRILAGLSLAAAALTSVPVAANAQTKIESRMGRRTTGKRTKPKTQSPAAAKAEVEERVGKKPLQVAPGDGKIGAPAGSPLLSKKPRIHDRKLPTDMSVPARPGLRVAPRKLK